MSELLKQIENEIEIAQTQFIKDVQQKLDQIEQAEKDNDENNKNKKLLFDLNKQLENIERQGFELLNGLQIKLEEEQKRLGIFVPINQDYVDQKYIARRPLEIFKVDNIQTGKCPRCGNLVNSTQTKCSCDQILTWTA